MENFPFYIADVAMRSSVILVLGLGLLWAMKRASASERHLVMGLALAAVVCIPIGALACPRWTWTISLPEPAQLDGPTTIQSSAVLALDRFLIAEQLRLPSGEKIKPLTDWFTVSNGFAALYLFGTVTQLAFLGQALFWWQSLKRDARTIQLSDEVMRKAADFARMELPPVLISARLKVPVLLGWWHPVILLPKEASRWSSDRLTMVLCHELAHFRRRDSVWIPLFCVLQIAYWWHPLVWIAMSRLKREREQACDDLVVGQLHCAPDYADLIVSTAREVNSVSASIGALAVAMAGSGRSSLEARIRSILNPTLNRRPASGSSIALGLIITAIVGGLIATSQVQAQSAADATANTINASSPVQAKPASIPAANIIKLQLKVVEVSDKIFNQMVPANDVHFFEKTPCLIKNGGLIIIESGQHGWFSEGVVRSYPLSSVNNDKIGIPTTTITASPIFYGLNADFLWSKADNLLAVDSQVTSLNQYKSSDNKLEGTNLLDLMVHTVKTHVVLAEGKEINILVGEVSPDDIVSLKWEVNGSASPAEMNNHGAKDHLLLFIKRLPDRE